MDVIEIIERLEAYGARTPDAPYQRMADIIKAAANLVDHEFEHNTSNEWNDESNRRLVALMRAVYPDREPPIKA